MLLTVNTDDLRYAMIAGEWFFLLPIPPNYGQQKSEPC